MFDFDRRRTKLATGFGVILPERPFVSISMAFARKAAHPLLAKTIDGGKFLDVEAFLLDNEMVAACNRVDAPLIDAIWNDFDKILELAVHMEIEEEGEEKVKKSKNLTTRATECIGNPSIMKKVCEKDLHEKKLFNKFMRYLAPEYDRFYKDHPVFAGHLSHILSLALVSLDNGEQLSDEQRLRLLKAMVRQIDQVGFQDMLIQAMTDGRFDTLNGSLVPACRYIAEELYSFSETPGKSEHLCGGVWALLTAFSDRESDENVQVVAKDVEFMANLVAAVFNKPEADMHTYLAFCHGIRLIGNLVERVEKEKRPDGAEYGVKNGVSRLLKQFSKQWYKKMGVDEIEWGTLTKAPVKAKRGSREWLMIQAFPVLWYYPIDYMFPLFFKDEDNFFGDFSMAFFNRVKNMSRARFVDFIDRHKIIEEILEKAPKFALTEEVQQECFGEGQRLQHPKPSLNMWIMSLARAIAGKREPVEDGGPLLPCTPHCLLRDSNLETRFSEFLWQHALPDRECRNFNWAAKEA